MSTTITHTQLPELAREYLEQLQKNVDHYIIDDLADFLADGEWNSGPYKLGLANGLLFALSHLIEPHSSGLIVLEIPKTNEDDIQPIKSNVADDHMSTAPLIRHFDPPVDSESDSSFGDGLDGPNR